MNKEYIIYFDSGTTNTRIYVLNYKMEIIISNKKQIGAKESAI